MVDKSKEPNMQILKKPTYILGIFFYDPVTSNTFLYTITWLARKHYFIILENSFCNLLPPCLFMHTMENHSTNIGHDQIDFIIYFWKS